MDSPDQALHAAAVGPSWDTYYRDRFGRIAAGGGIVQWNRAAALVPLWCAWRRLPYSGPVLFAEYLAVAFVALWFGGHVSQVTAVVLAIVTVGAVAGALQGAFGTWWVYRAAQRAVRKVAGQDHAEALVRLGRRTPRRGMVPDLVHVVMSAIFLCITFVAASMALGHGRGLEERAFRGMMRAELRRLAGAQDSFFLAHGRHAGSLDELGITTRPGIELVLRDVTATGWSAEVRHAGVPREVCRMAKASEVECLSQPRSRSP